MDWKESGVAFDQRGCMPVLDPHGVHMLGSHLPALHNQHILAGIQHGWDMDLDDTSF